MMGRNRQGLRTLSADLINKARDDMVAQVNRLLLTFVGTVAFCLLSLLSPDSALLAGQEGIGPVLSSVASAPARRLCGPSFVRV